MAGMESHFAMEQQSNDWAPSCSGNATSKKYSWQKNCREIIGEMEATRKTFEQFECIEPVSQLKRICLNARNIFINIV